MFEQGCSCRKVDLLPVTVFPFEMKRQIFDCLRIGSQNATINILNWKMPRFEKSL